MLIHMKEISTSFYVEDKWLQTRRRETLFFPLGEILSSLYFKNTAACKDSTGHKQTAIPKIESLIRKTVGEIWRAEPTIRFHPSCLQRQKSTFPEYYYSILTELLWSAAIPSLLSDCQLHSKQIRLLHNQVFSSPTLLRQLFHQMILDSKTRFLRSKG